MFGGVEQLIRDSHQWIYRDSQQVAMGFENWTGMDVDPSIWADGVIGDGSLNGGALNGAVSTGMSMPGTQPPVYGMNTNASMSGYPMINWLDGSNAYNSMATTYNEDEWYQ